MTWPALVAQGLGYEYETYARPGAGNLQILERLLNQIDSDDPAIYVIGWTYIDRFDYVDPHLVTPWPGTRWKTIMPIDTDAVATSYFRDLHSEYSDKFRTLTYIKTALDCLRENQCKFVMTTVDPLAFCRQWHTTRATARLADQVSPWMRTFEGDTFVNWSRMRGFAISDTMHPLEQAHSAAANLVLDQWDQYLCHSA